MAPTATWTLESWAAPGRVDDALADFEGWNPIVRRLITSVAAAPEEAEIYRQRLYSETELEALLAAAGLELAERRPMWPAIPAQLARGRTLWVARPPG